MSTTAIHKPNPSATSATRHPLSRWLAVALGIAITSIGGLLYGKYSHRWGPAPNLNAAGAHLKEFPKQIGTWRMVDESPIDQSAVTMLECAGYVNRQYVNEKTGHTIQLAILVGPPGPIAVHTPEICFSSRAYEIEGPRTEVTVPGNASPENTFWKVDFTARNRLASALRTYYGWSTGGPWEASANPRFQFGAAPMLFKLQLAAELPPGSAETHSDAGLEFLTALAASQWTPRSKF